MIAIRCPGCAAPMRVPEEFGGRRIRCRDCRTEFAVPAVTPAAAPPGAPVTRVRAVVVSKKSDAVPDRPRRRRPAPPPGPNVGMILGIVGVSALVIAVLAVVVGSVGRDDGSGTGPVARLERPEALSPATPAMGPSSGFMPPSGGSVAPEFAPPADAPFAPPAPARPAPAPPEAGTFKVSLSNARYGADPRGVGPFAGPLRSGGKAVIFDYRTGEPGALSGGLLLVVIRTDGTKQTMGVTGGGGTGTTGTISVALRRGFGPFESSGDLTNLGPSPSIYLARSTHGPGYTGEERLSNTTPLRVE